MISLKKTLTVCSVLVILLSNCSSVLALENIYNSEKDVQVASIENNREDFIFSNKDVLKAAEKLYNEGLFTKEQYQIVYSAYTQRLGIKGENKVVHIANGVMDVYINNVTWSALIGLGGFGAGLLLGAIPGINASVAAGIAAVGGAVGGAFFGAERGVIARMKMVYEPATQISGSKAYYKVVSWREQ